MAKPADDQVVRTSISISDALLQRAKHAAIEERDTLGGIIAKALNLYLQRRTRAEK